MRRGPAMLRWVIPEAGNAPMPDTAVDLYRSCKSSAWAGKGVDKKTQGFVAAEGRTSLHPDFTGFTRKDGRFRPPDVTTITDARGVVWVRGVEDRDASGRPFVNASEGVSVSTTVGGFGYSGWFYFLVPTGTAIPASLDVTATPTRNDSGHYSIRCRTLMRKDAYEGALDTLARSAIARAVAQARQSLYFS
jgi:hypothetical protein